MDTYPVTEFEAVLEKDGTIRLPKELVKHHQPGSTVIVRLVEGTINPELRARGVQEDEIETIARVQLEQRENVISFLTTEGSFSRNKGFIRSTSALFGERT